MIEVFLGLLRKISATDSAPSGGLLFSIAKKVTKNACPSIRPFGSLRSPTGSLPPSRFRRPAYKGHPWPFMPLAASMRLALLRRDSARPSERGGLVPSGRSQDRNRPLRCFLVSNFSDAPEALTPKNDLRKLGISLEGNLRSFCLSAGNLPDDTKRPRQEAERRRCAGGRATRMSREASRAMDGPWVPAPGAAPERGNPGAAGAGCRGQAFLVTFFATEKSDPPGGAEQKAEKFRKSPRKTADEKSRALNCERCVRGENLRISSRKNSKHQRQNTWRAYALALCALAGSALLPAPAQAAPLFDPFKSAGIDDRPGAQVPLDLRFTDRDGTPLTLAQAFGGKPVVLAPVYYRCPNVCGAQLANLVQMLANLDYRIGRDYALVAFSFDPRETPADAAREHDELARRWPRIVDSQDAHFLVGEAPAIEALVRAIGFRFRYDPAIGQYAHVSALATLAADGRLSRWLYGLGYQPNDLRLALTESGQGQVGSLGDQVLLLCYHYDPSTGGYDNLVIRALQVGGIATCLALAGFILFAIRRERRRQARGAGP